MTRALLVLVGPTAAGKSALAMQLARLERGELVSADSVQVYRGVDIGSAKPSAAEQAEIPHHGIDLVDPGADFDAHAWARHADAAIEAIRSRGAHPIVVGGTGLYVRALLHGLSRVPPISEAVRAEVRRALDERGAPALHEALAQVDPAAAARIEPTDPQRIGRALEVYRETGRTLSSFQAEHGFREQRHRALVIGLWPPREVLYGRIEARVHRMIAAGWVEEVRQLLAAGVPEGCAALSALGYREVVAHLRGEISAERLPEAIALGHRRYARRQLTWFRGVTTREDDLRHMDPRDPATVDRIGELWRQSSRVG